MLKMKDFKLTGRRVLIREDLNVPLGDGEITDLTRIEAALPTLRLALEQGARVMVMSHLGRPKEGERDPALSLAPVAAKLGELLGREVRLVSDWLDGVDVAEGELVLLENVRFNTGEKTNDDDLARRMALLCEVYVNDAFGSAHRAHASTHGVAKYAPFACAGPLLEAEMEALGRAMLTPARPTLAIVGGAKVSTKLEVLETLSQKVDRLIVGGGIANTFLKAAGHPVGRSLCEDSLVDTARRLMDAARSRNAEVPLPEDVVCAKEPGANAAATVKAIAEVADDDMILDVGPRTAERISTLVREARTIIWNGPLGVFEFDQFGAGTRSLALAIAESEAFSLAGGGDTLAAIAKYGVGDRISYISTGGGAFLEYLEGKTLPAIAILEERDRASPEDVHPCEGY